MSGPLTPTELAALEAYAAGWSDRHLRTEPIDAARIAPSIAALYALDGLPVPTIIVVPSPGVLAFAGTLAAWAWAQRDRGHEPVGLPLPAGQPVVQIESSDIAEATRRATLAALAGPDVWKDRAGMPAAECFDPGFRAYSEADADVANATDRSVHEGMESVTAELLDLHDALKDQMRDPFNGSKPTPRLASAREAWGDAVAHELFADADTALRALGDWFRQTQAGNTAAHWEFRISAARDVLGLSLPSFDAYADWESAAIHGGPRYMHPRFCLVSDFPASLDAKNLPSHTLGTGYNAYRWRDGWSV